MSFVLINETPVDVGAGADEIIALRAKVAELKARLESERVGSSMQFDHINALKAKLEVARQVIVEVNYRLQQDRIWGGMEWVYHDIRPFKYLPLVAKTNEALDAIKEEA